MMVRAGSIVPRKVTSNSGLVPPLQQDTQSAARIKNEYATLKRACKTEMNDLRGVVKTAEDANDYTIMINGKL